ncbi:DUF262 domain-containing protein [Synechococcus sp. CCAP 1479/9]|uniref:DUF262 domain-containing protein n=1 Tax=Synechococcus sp. CCAP 1479/9 TaxID=1221593 RepID=UPI001C228FB3
MAGLFNNNRSMSIAASQKSIREILRPEDYQFVVPAYQRPYAWEKNQAQQLVDDLLDAYGDNPDSDYFLGSVVIVKQEGSPKSEIVDGQQRLTSLSILISVIRHLVPEHLNQVRSDIGQILLRDFMGVQSKGLVIRKSDQVFFHEMIVVDGGIRRLRELRTSLSSSQQCIKNNAEVFANRLESMIKATADKARFPQEFLKYILHQVRLVLISDDDFRSAYRIFSTMNNRGLPLGVSDLLKAILLEQISDSEIQHYTEIWEREEGSLTELSPERSEEYDSNRKFFELLFTHIHRINAKQRSSSNLFTDFQKDVLKNSHNPLNETGAKAFINQQLVPCSKAYATILDNSFNARSHSISEAINDVMLPLLKRIPNSDWQPPAIMFLSRYRDNEIKAKEFIVRLERVAACSLLLRENVNARARRYKPILEALEESHDEALTVASNSITPQDAESVLAAINRDLYGEAYAQYVMIRLDCALAEGGLSPCLKSRIITIEHVLPQTLTDYWGEDWSVDQHGSWINRIGNLILLSKRKNSQAQNYDFTTKKATYFGGRSEGVGSVTTFPTATNVLSVNGRWTPSVVELRQSEYCQKLSEVWQLQHVE